MELGIANGLIGIFVAVIGGVVGFIFKIFYDWLKNGRAEKGEFVKVSACEKFREKCGVSALETTIESRLKKVETMQANTEKQLENGRQDFKEIRLDIGDMKVHVAGMKVLLEKFVEENARREAVK